jgi:nicotinate-nucleotide adenylyltransferase
MPKRIGIFGGSFDPVHNGHVMLANAALDELSLDVLYLIPTAQSPFKPDDKPVGGGARVKLLLLAFAGRENCEVNEQELQRGGISYTIDTVRDYTVRHPDAELTCLIGADHVPLLPQWREADELADRAAFAAVPRPGGVTVDFPAPFRGRWLRGVPVNVSASDIRARVRGGQPFGQLVPPTVAEAIRDLKLYAD